jgi:hypothetical protein
MGTAAVSRGKSVWDVKFTAHLKTAPKFFKHQKIKK